MFRCGNPLRDEQDSQDLNVIPLGPSIRPPLHILIRFQIHVALTVLQNPLRSIHTRTTPSMALALISASNATSMHRFRLQPTYEPRRNMYK